ncbi:VCBS domain-containing protein [Halarcobacter sp.]|uniref:VCBS domain-containing protein n=1 Tax=Halarcobacter sp. TaxID=2321133 RepID=UPI003A8EA568
MYEGIRIQNGTQTVELNSLPKSENGELILTGIETLKVYLSNGASYLDANLEILENNDDVKIAFIDSNGDEVVIILRGLNVMLLTNSEEIPLLEVIDGNNSLISLRTIEDLDAAAAGATASSDVATADELEGDNLDLSTTFDGPSNPEGFGGLGEPIVVEPAAAETITFSGDISATITEDTGQSQNGVFSGTISNSAGLAFVPNSVTTSYGVFTINSTGTWTYDLDETLTNVQGLLDSESIIDNIVVSLIDGTTSFTIGVTIAGLNDKPEIENIFIGAYNDEINEGDLSFETSSKIDFEGVDDTSSEANNQYTGVINISDADISNTHNLSIISGSENIVDYNNSGVTLDDISISLVFNETTNEWEYNIEGDFSKLAVGESLTLSFDYQADDLRGFSGDLENDDTSNENSLSDIKTITLSVLGTNDKPVITDITSSSQIDETNTALTTNGLISVSDVDTTDEVTMHVDSVTISGTSNTKPTNAEALSMFSFSSNQILDNTQTSNSVNWEFNSGNENFDYLSEGETIVLEYVVSALDNNLISSTNSISESSTSETKTVTVTITGTNDVVELASTVVSGDVVEDASDPVLSDSGDIAFTDVDLSDGHTVSVGNASVGALGVLTASITEGNDGDGAGVVSWEYTVSNADVQYLSAGETKEESFDITIDDGNGSTDTKTVTVTITGTNDAPIITGGPDTADLIETDLGLTADGELTVSDVDILDLVSASVDSVSIGGTATSKPTNQDVIGMLSLSPLAILDNAETTDTLSWSFDSGNEAFDYLEEGETLILEYTVKAVDDHGAFDTETVTITITGTSDNEPPELQADTFDIVEDSAVGAYVGTVVATDVDGDSLTFTLLNNTDKFAIDNSGNITYIGNESNKLDYETTTEYNLNIQVSDGELTDVQSYTVDILNLNEEVSGGGTEILSGEGFTGTETNDNSNHIHTTSTEITGVVIENTESFDFTFGYTDNGGAVHTANVYDSSGTLVVSESFVAEKGEGSVTFSYTNNTGTDLTLTKLELVSTNSGFNFDSYSINYSLTSDQILTLAEVDTDGDHIDFVRLLEDSSNDLTSGIEPNSLDKVDMSSGDHILSNINVEDVLTITDTDNTLKIVGDSGDTLKLDASQWTDNGVNVDGETVYVGTSTTNETVTLLIEGVNIEEIS